MKKKSNNKRKKNGKEGEKHLREKTVRQKKYQNFCE